MRLGAKASMVPCGLCLVFSICRPDFKLEVVCLGFVMSVSMGMLGRNGCSYWRGVAFERQE